MGKVNIDRIDRTILRCLSQDARMSFMEIARMCGVSGAAIHQRVKKLEDSGVITSYKVGIDPRALGYDLCAFVGLRFSDHSMIRQMGESLRNLEEVVECHFITGNCNILVKLFCRDNDHLMHTIFDKLLSTPGVSGAETFISLGEVFAGEICVAEEEE